MRRFVAEESEDRRWTVFDGPIDALWIENMNTVLDDNMTLCLANGERIKLKAEMKCLFEVNDLAAASPATVSRIGVVYVTPTDLGWYATIQTWVETRMPEGTSDAIKQHILGLFKTYTADALKFQRKYCKEPVVQVDFGLTASQCFIFESLFKPEKGLNLSLPEENLMKLVNQIFLFSCTTAKAC